MNRSERIARLAGARSGHLATVRPDGRPHVVVVTYAVIDETVVTAIDYKPKTTQRLQRLVNIEANPLVSFLVDYYDDDWRRLWWVRVDGPAAIHQGGEIREQALEALAVRYPQYQDQPPDGPVISISAIAINSWAHSE